MQQVMNGHYSGQLKTYIDKAVKNAKGKSGQFYSIMNSHGFYDVDDENNGLADWQRAGVPEYNQHRISDLCDAIAEMIGDILSNPEYGILDPGVQGCIDTLDQRGAMTAAEMDGIGAAVGTLTGGAAETARQSISSLVASVMGGNKFNPMVIPPICLGFGGLPISFANAFKPGTFVPDWTFLYEHETFKSNKFYAADDGSVAIGAGIKLNTGGPIRILLLKFIFAVPDTDSNGMPKGDAVNGVTAEQFQTIFAVSDKQYSELTDEEKEFSLTEGQLQVAYFKMVQTQLWGAIKNPNNWAYLHWGCVTHNSCPEPVKTAVCSFIKTNGLAVDPNICPEAGLISYLVNTGMAYLIGVEKRIGLLPLPGMTYIDGEGNKQKFGSMQYGIWFTNNKGVPKDESLAKQHFALAADVLSHLTYDTNPNAKELRQRRVDEANKIYNYCGYPTKKFGNSDVPSSLSAQGMSNRGLETLVSSEIKVYDNKALSVPSSMDNIKISNQAEKGSSDLSDKTTAIIKYLCATAQIPGVVVTSVFRDSVAQARVMSNNRQEANGGFKVNYGPRGKAVDAEYTKIMHEKYGPGSQHKLEPSDLAVARKKMAAKCEEYFKAGTPVSNHGQDPSIVQAVDMGPDSTRKAFKLSSEQLKRFHSVCYDAYKDGLLKQYLGPAEYGGPKTKDPAFHIEVWQNNKYKAPPGVAMSAEDLNVVPEVSCKVLDENLKNKNTWNLVYLHDQNLATKE